MVSKAYRIGFARTALLRETVVVAQLFNELKDWSQVKQTVIADNVLQARAIRTGSIIFSEIHKRLTLLTDEQIELIGEDSPQDVRQLVWIGICKQYQFIGEFSVEVLAAVVLPTYPPWLHCIAWEALVPPLASCLQAPPSQNTRFQPCFEFELH